MMTTEEALNRWGIIPPLSSLEDIRIALGEEIKRRQSDTDYDENDDGFDDLLLLLCVQLFAARQPEDSLSIWRAKQCDFDAFFGIEGKLLLGAGVEETRQFLWHCKAPEATNALEYINEGDWANFSYEEHLAHYKRYFSS